MHTLVRRFIKTGGVFLMVGLVLGFWIMVSRELPGRGVHPYLVSAHTHALLSGFMLFLIFGGARWEPRCTCCPCTTWCNSAR